MRSLILSCALLTLPGTIPLAAQGWIHDLKSAPDKYLGQEVTVEGIVAGARAGVPGELRAGGGSYFLVDASDPAGIRVRTSRVPPEGARFEVKGLLRGGARGEGAMVLVEIDRTRIGSSPLLIAVAAGSALLTFLLLLMFLRARRAERRHLLGAPLWLLPTADSTPEGGSAMRLDPSRDRTDLAVGSQLSRRKHVLLMAVGAMTVATSSSAGWVAWAELSARDRAVLWQPSGFSASGADTTSPVPGPPTADSAPTMLVVTPPPPPSASPGRLRPPPPSEPGSAPVRAERAAPSTRPPPPAPPVASPETTVVLTVPRRLPTATVLPLPPPPPPPTVVDSAAARAHREEQLRLAAETGLRVLQSRLLGAIVRADRAELAALWPSGLGSKGFRDRFLDFVGGFRPEATLGQSESPAILGDIAQSRSSIAMTWRGDFGVTRTSIATFVLALRRSGASWTVEGVHLTARFP